MVNDSINYLILYMVEININIKWFLIIFVVHVLLFGDNTSIEDYKHDKKYYITKVDSSMIKDKFVHSHFWNNIKIISDLVQIEPNFNQSPSNRTEIKLCYDESYLYILVDLYQEKENISYKKGDYDDFVGTFESSSDYFIIEIDSYHDHATSYGFAVNSSGINADYMIYSDEYIDDDWNAPWLSKVTNHNKGWSIEYKIPFSILRYSLQPENIWGINFIRYIKNKNEYISWVAIPQDKMGIVSQFGHLHGLDLHKNRSIQFKTHGIGGKTFYDDNFYGFIIDDSNNIIGLNFDSGEEEIYNKNLTSSNAGFDFKYIINSNSNIDFTYRPSFNHINQDPSDINNTAYETYYDERRDFFLENAIFFNTPIQIFYSRRIGGIEKNVDNYSSFLTKLESAAKYTYKNDKTNYGLLLAYSKPSSFRDLAYTYDIYSSVIRFSRKIVSNKHNIGFIGTNSSNKNIDSNVYGLDYSFNFINNQLYIDSQIAYSDTKFDLGKGSNFEIGYRTNSLKFLDKVFFIDCWISNNKYNKSFNINDLGYFFRNDLNEYNFGLSFTNEQSLIKTNFIIQYYFAKNFSDDILSDIISFKYNLNFKNSSYLIIGVSKEFDHFNDRYYDYFFNLDLEKVIKAPNNNTINIEYGNDLRKDLSYTTNIKSFKNNINDKGNNYVFDINYNVNNWIELNFSYDLMEYYETYHFLKIRQLPNGINFNSTAFINTRDEYQYLFTNSNNKEIYYTSKISSYLDKLTLQLYSEYYLYQNNWNENGNVYKISVNDENYTYPNPVNTESTSLIDYDVDKILYSAFYSSINLNFVIQWNFLENSNIYFLYRLNKGVNGKKFNNPMDLINFNKNDINDSSIAEIFYDSSLFIKYELLLRNK